MAYTRSFLVFFFQLQVGVRTGFLGGTSANARDVKDPWSCGDPLEGRHGNAPGFLLRESMDRKSLEGLFLINVKTIH